VLTDLNGSSFDFANGVALAPAGKIVAAGFGGGDFAVVRYNRDGSLDQSFGSDGEVLTDFGSSSYDFLSGVAIEPGGKIIAAGGSGSILLGTSYFALARYLAR